VSPRKLLFILAGIAVAAALTGCGSKAHSRPPPRRVSGPLIGVMIDGPALRAGVSLPAELARVVADGAESLRVSVDWSQTQPYRTAARVPVAQRSQFQDVAGVPTRFSGLDRVVSAAAARGLTLLPVVEYTPSWDAVTPGNRASPPRAAAPFAAFLTALVNRYGPRGSFWSTHRGVPRVPIRMWQIWNEPNFTSYWSQQPFAPGYVRLLAAAHAALKSADPGAKVVLSGFADFSWRYLSQVYRVPGARNLFDVVAIHPYTATPAGVLVILQRARDVMNRSGDRAKPILATEITWPSSAGKAPPQFGVGVTEAQQAQRLARVLPLLEARRARLGLMGFYWYTWMGDETPGVARYGFNYAGLLKYVRGTVTAKPALSVFSSWSLRAEACRRKTTAQTCSS
jgi:hypothetical protein